MSFVAVILIVISAFLHAGWNLLSKSRHPTAAFFVIAGVSGSLMLSPALVVWHETLLQFPPRVWLLLVATGFFMALYYASLAGAYRSGDMSLAYPLARSSPVIVVMVVTLILGRGDQVSTLCVVGIVLVTVGCFVMPIKTLRTLSLRSYLDATCGLALLAAVGTSGYSIIDDEALRILRESPDVTIGPTQTSILYVCIEAMFGALWLGLFVVLRRESRAELLSLLRTNRWHAVVTGLTICVTYGLVLISLAFVDNVSYVVGFRQLSIPLGAAFGVFILKEQPHRLKSVGVAVMFVGLLLVAFG